MTSDQLAILEAAIVHWAWGDYTLTRVVQKVYIEGSILYTVG